MLLKRLVTGVLIAAAALAMGLARPELVVADAGPDTSAIEEVEVPCAVKFDGDGGNGGVVRTLSRNCWHQAVALCDDVTRLGRMRPPDTWSVARCLPEEFLMWNFWNAGEHAGCEARGRVDEAVGQVAIISSNCRQRAWVECTSGLGPRYGEMKPPGEWSTSPRCRPGDEIVRWGADFK